MLTLFRALTRWRSGVVKHNIEHFEQLLIIDKLLLDMKKKKMPMKKKACIVDIKKNSGKNT